MQAKMNLLSPARQLSYTAILLSQPHLKIKRCTVLNPATLIPTADEGEPHDCKTETEQLQLPRPDLTDVPLPTGEVLFVDGSCFKDDSGKTKTGYAVVSLPHNVTEAKQIQSHHSAQAAELIALIRACELMKGCDVTIYTDSQYALSAIFFFAKQWERRGMVTSTGKTVVHAELIIKLLEAIQLPNKIALIKCTAHSKGTDTVSRGNRLADETAKEAAAGQFGPSDIYLLQKTEQIIDSEVLLNRQQTAPTAEKQMWVKNGATVNLGGFYTICNKPVLPKSLFQAAAMLSHGVCHVSTGGMVTVIQQHFTTYGFLFLCKKFCKACTICVRHNPQGNIRPKRGQFPEPQGPFEVMHMDFIELTQSGPYKYCLVMIDAFSNWVEIVPAKHTDALTVAKAICKVVVPNFGIPQKIYSDNGPHFVNQVIQQMASRL
ncbi:uncharacterized protein LOC110368189 [Fundulus heteroclitus]|uniref:uncharacterized protein LOC110368189 n=1 Tax=Fundulus heteroclitus TaxID=8078 RepID=UPI00165A91A7|nr:uncharacterized protein LOC110368189 [Fundulus heteroclitus]